MVEKTHEWWQGDDGEMNQYVVKQVFPGPSYKLYSHDGTLSHALLLVCSISPRMK